MAIKKLGLETEKIKLIKLGQSKCINYFQEIQRFRKSLLNDLANIEPIAKLALLKDILMNVDDRQKQLFTKQMIAVTELIIQRRIEK